MSNGVSALLGFADSGIRFVFGDLASNGFIFAVRVLPLVIFISTLIAVLYHFGIMQWVISNAIDALAGGAVGGMKIVVAIGTMFVSVITMINAGFATVGGWFGWTDLSLQLLLGYLFAPMALLIGVPRNEMMAAGSLISQKVIMNEFVAYLDFASVRQDLSAHSQIITFALCGFANLGSIAIQLGSIGTMAPERCQDVARMGCMVS